MDNINDSVPFQDTEMPIKALDHLMPPLLTDYHALAARQSRRRKMQKMMMLVAFSLNIAGGVYLIHIRNQPEMVLMAPFLCTFSVLFALYVYTCTRIDRSQANHVRKLGQCTNKQYTGLVIDVLHDCLYAKPMLYTTLIRLLTSFTSQDLTLLTASQRARLITYAFSSFAESKPCDDIRQQTQIQLAQATVKAMKLVGDESNYRQLARIFLRMVDETSPNLLRQELGAALPQMRARLDIQLGPETLLRASQLEQEPGTLLRAAAPGSMHTRPEQLLRGSLDKPEKETVSGQTITTQLVAGSVKTPTRSVTAHPDQSEMTIQRLDHHDDGH